MLFAIETLSMFVLALVYLAEVGLFSEEIAALIRSELSDVSEPFLVVRASFIALLAVAYLFTTIGLLRLWPWAWTTAMVILGIRLAEGLGAFLFNSPEFALMFLSVLSVFLLNQREVRKAFGIVKEKRVPAESIQRTNNPVRR